MIKQLIATVALASASLASAQVTIEDAEAGPLSQQAYHALIAFAETRVAKRPTDSVVLAAGAPLVKGSFVPCGDKPLAVLLTVEGTVLNGSKAFPGVGHAVGDLRKAGMKVVFAADRADAAAALTAAKLGPVVSGQDFFVGRDNPTRANIATKYCVIAMVGSRLTDFRDIFADLPPDVRRATAVHSRAAGEWGKGWFIVPSAMAPR